MLTRGEWRAFWWGFTHPFGDARKYARSVTVDYVTLLAKYVRYVGECEGVTYLDWPQHGTSVDFTEDEWAELQRLDVMVDDDVV